MSDLKDHPDYATNSDRVINRKQLVPILQDVFHTKTTKEWVDEFEAASIPCGPVLKFSEIFEDPHVQAREQVVEVQHPTAGKIKMTGIPVKLSGTPGEIKSAPPVLGQNTREILSSVAGLTDEQIEALERGGVVMAGSVPERDIV